MPYFVACFKQYAFKMHTLTVVHFHMPWVTTFRPKPKVKSYTLYMFNVPVEISQLIGASAALCFLGHRQSGLMKLMGLRGSIRIHLD